MNIRTPEKSTIASIAVVAILIGIISSWPVTNVQVRELSKLIQPLALLCSATCLAMYMTQLKVPLGVIVSLVAFLVFFTYGTLLSVLYGGINTAIRDLPITLILVSAGIMATGIRKKPLERRECNYIVGFIVFIFVINVVTGGIILEFPPRYIFSLKSNAIGSTVQYGQGVTKFFGIGAILAAYLLATETRRYYRGTLIFLMIFFIIFSLIGGARGDSIGVLLAIFLVYFPKAPLKVTLLSIGIGLLFYVLVNYFVQSGSFVLLNRMQSVLSGSSGIRETLYQDAFQLLLDNTNCFVFGCGFDFYQFSLGYEQSLYPHNFILEFSLVWGVPLASTSIFFFGIGLLKVFNSKSDFDAFFLIVIYLVFIFLKSGTVISGGLFLIGFFHYAAEGFLLLIRPNAKKNIHLSSRTPTPS